MTIPEWSGAKIGALSSGDTIYYGDKLVVTYMASTGYHFEVNGSYPTSITNEFVVTKAVTATDITAKPVINTYNIVYNSNGGPVSIANEYNIKYGTTKTISDVAAPRGWIFDGWKYSNSDKTTWGKTHGETIKLDAQWTLVTTKTYTRSNFYVSKNENDSNHSVWWDFNTRNDFDVDYMIQNGYKMRMTVSYHAAYQNNAGYIINYLWDYESVKWIKKYQPEFKSSINANWSIEASAGYSNLTIEFTSGNVWMWDCTSYNVENIKVVIEYYK